MNRDITVPRDITNDLYGMFEKKVYDRDEIIRIVKRWADKNQNIKSNLSSPENIEANDIVLFDVAGQKHPCVIFKKEGNVCHGIILSTKEKECHFIHKVENSRIFTKSNFTSTIVSMEEGQAKNNFIGIFDSPRELKIAVKLVRQKYKKIL